MTQDHEIMLSVKNGDIQKLGLLFDKYSKGLFNYFRVQLKDSSTSEDLVQNVFYSILKYRHTFREGADFKVWMYTIARNEKINYFKGRKFFDREIEPEQPDEENKTPEDNLMRKGDVDLLKKALERISPDNRELITLNRFNGLSYSEIRKILKCEIGALRVRMHRAINELKEQFNKISEECKDEL